MVMYSIMRGVYRFLVAGEYRKRVLFVDDEPQTVQIYSGFLKEANFEVEVATDGLEALAKIEKFRPHLIITDHVMPKLNGIELLRRMNELSSPPKLILISTFATADLRDEAFSLGAEEVLDKTFDEDELVEVAEQALLRRNPTLEPQKRDPEELENKFFCYIRDNPGQLVNIVGRSQHSSWSSAKAIIDRMVAGGSLRQTSGYYFCAGVPPSPLDKFDPVAREILRALSYTYEHVPVDRLRRPPTMTDRTFSRHLQDLQNQDLIVIEMIAGWDRAPTSRLRTATLTKGKGNEQRVTQELVEHVRATAKLRDLVSSKV